MIKKIAVIFFVIICAWHPCHAQIITTIAGTDSAGFSGDNGPATNARMAAPIGVTVDTANNVYFTVETARIRKVNTSGIITSVCGNGINGFSGEGVPATDAEISYLAAYLKWKGDNLYLPDYLNTRIRCINSSGIINTIAGDSISASTGDNGLATAAELCGASGIAFDKKGNLYFSDNCAIIRKIDTSGIITTIAGMGSPGYSGDGGAATLAKFQDPIDLAIDLKGNVYVTDLGNNTIRKIDTNYIISTFTGSDTLGGYTGDDGPSTNAKIHGPEGITVDDVGNVYFSDCGNNVIRKIDTVGIITTIVGDSIAGFYGDGGAATAAELNKPAGLAFDKEGNLYIADWINNRIRKVSNVGVMLHTDVVHNKLEDLKIYPNPAGNFITIDGAINYDVEILDVVGRVVMPCGKINKGSEIVDVSQLVKGVYTVQITDVETGVRVVKKIIKM